jgi:hypothetical protein
LSNLKIYDLSICFSFDFWRIFVPFWGDKVEDVVEE